MPLLPRWMITLMHISETIHLHIIQHPHMRSIKVISQSTINATHVHLTSLKQTLGSHTRINWVHTLIILACIPIQNPFQELCTITKPLHKSLLMSWMTISPIRQLFVMTSLCIHSTLWSFHHPLYLSWMTTWTCLRWSAVIWSPHLQLSIECRCYIRRLSKHGNSMYVTAFRSLLSSL